MDPVAVVHLAESASQGRSLVHVGGRPSNSNSEGTFDPRDPGSDRRVER